MFRLISFALCFLKYFSLIFDVLLLKIPLYTPAAKNVIQSLRMLVLLFHLFTTL